MIQTIRKWLHKKLNKKNYYGMKGKLWLIIVDGVLFKKNRIEVYDEAGFFVGPKNGEQPLNRIVRLYHLPLKVQKSPFTVISYEMQSKEEQRLSIQYDKFVKESRRQEAIEAAKKGQYLKSIVAFYR